MGMKMVAVAMLLAASVMSAQSKAIANSIGNKGSPPTAPNALPNQADNPDLTTASASARPPPEAVSDTKARDAHPPTRADAAQSRRVPCRSAGS